MTDTLFETHQFKVTAGAELPVVLGEDNIMWVAAYAVTHKPTEQVQNEFRSIADAMLYCVKWEQDMQAAEEAALKLLGATSYGEAN